MIREISTLTATSTNPYRNLALEQYLLHNVKDEECILYLWQNQKTVVIGKNQNSWKECKVEKLEQSGGHLARRLSGGGAVFHDLGNLNFTFLVKKQDYDVDRQLNVILKAVRKYDILADKTGRNDITVDGKKISGNAFYQNGDACYHHGTILIHADKEEMSDYLNVSAEKLRSNSVSSVKSRVANLKEFQENVTVPGMIEKLCESFEEVYGCKARKIEEASIPEEELKEGTDRFSSWQWNYGRKIKFNVEFERKFPWGEVQIQLNINEGKVKEAEIFSDGLELSILELVKEVLPGTVYEGRVLGEKVRRISIKEELQKEIREDLACLFLELQKG